MDEIRHQDFYVDGFNKNQLQTEKTEEEQARSAEETRRAAQLDEAKSGVANRGLEREVVTLVEDVEMRPQLRRRSSMASTRLIMRSWPRPWRSVSSWPR